MDIRSGHYIHVNMAVGYGGNENSRCCSSHFFIIIFFSLGHSVAHICLYRRYLEHGGMVRQLDDDQCAIINGGNNIWYVYMR